MGPLKYYVIEEGSSNFIIIVCDNHIYRVLNMPVIATNLVSIIVELAEHGLV